MASDENDPADCDLLAGFGRWSDEHAEVVRAVRERAKAESRDRMRRLQE